MSCNSAEALFERFLDGELPRAQRDNFLTHVDRCADCRSLIEELRAVDALLHQPRQIELAPNFTFATMAEARTLPPPGHYTPPIRAYLVSYVVAAWLIAGAALLIAPQMMQALGGTTLDLARDVSDAFGGLGAVIVRLFARGGSLLTAVLGALLALDVMLVAGFGLALKYVRPRLVERLRS